jgi:hypothetical protein
MKTLTFIFLLSISSMGFGQGSQKMNIYNGKFCSGSGDVDFLRLIDESFAFFHPNPTLPNLSMVYKPEWDTFTEGAGWDAWWIQNSYGFSYASTPFIQEPWFSILQRSWDLFWDNQGDGKRRGMWGGDSPDILSQLIGPDGCLGDAAAPGQIAYRQGDGNVKSHDWFYEATAAGVVMESEILLRSRDLKSIGYYLPKMERGCNLIEKTRDPNNNLFLVGPACNLLAPSYGGVRQPDGSFGKGYLAGLTVTYLAALDRMVELFKLTGNKDKLMEYKRRQKITRESLSKLLTPANYLVRSIEPDGIKHGVLGQKQFGYLEGVVNADAVALRVVDKKIAGSIYKQIASFPEIRPFDFLLTNAPGLDDTYMNWGNTSGRGFEGFWGFGQWVNGGVWGTVEGRAILMYYRLGKFEDIRRSAIRAMKWAKDFRMDAPWSQRGENTNNPWSDKGKFKVGGVAVMIDNFAIPAATIRGLFDYDYRSDRIILRPRVPGTITQYTQSEPISFGQKKLYLSCNNGGPNVKSVTINGKAIKTKTSDEVHLLFNELPEEAKIEITTTGGWPKESTTLDYPVIPAMVSEKNTKSKVSAEFPDSLKRSFAILSNMDQLLNKEKGSDYDKAFINSTMKSFEAYQVHIALDPGPGYYRAITQERKIGIDKFYEQAALKMYAGFKRRMEEYAAKGNMQQKHIATLFTEAQK